MPECHLIGPGERVWVPGYSPVSGNAKQFERQVEVLRAVAVPPPAIALHFRVEGYRRTAYFDMESLGYVVLAAWRHNLAYPTPVLTSAPYRPETIWLTMTASPEDRIGIDIAYESPPEPSGDVVVADVTIAQPPIASVRGTVIPELFDHSVLASSDWLGLDLTFGPEVDIGEFGYFGPVKPLIDAMAPLLGQDNRGGPADHRLHDLRIRHDGRIDGSVRARFWYSD